MKVSKKKLRVNHMVPDGFQFKVEEGEDGRWIWTVRQFGKALSSGNEENAQLARKQMRRALARCIETVAESGSQRRELRVKLRSWAQRRPYVAMHVFYRLADSITNRSAICSEAEDEEQALHTRAGKGAIKIPTHPLTKPAPEVAGVVFDTAMRLGLVGKRAESWANNMFGFAYSHPGQDLESLLDAAFDGARRGKKEKVAAHVEDEDDDAPIATPEDVTE